MPKAKAPPITADNVSNDLRAIGKLLLEEEHAHAQMQKQIDTAKTHWEPVIRRRQAAIDEYATRLRLGSEDSRESLLRRGAKSLRVLFGKIGWRKQGIKVKCARPKDQVAAALQRMGRDDLVRLRAEPDLRAIKDAGLAANTLKAAGLKVVPAGEDFYYEVDRAEVQKHEEA